MTVLPRGVFPPGASVVFALFYGRVVVHALEENPFAASVGPAFLRSRLARMPGTASGASRPAPASQRVPCEDAHHVVEVAVRRHRDVDVVAPALDVTGRDGAHGVAVRRSRAARGAEGEEIVLSHKILRRLLASCPRPAAPALWCNTARQRASRWDCCGCGRDRSWCGPHSGRENRPAPPALPAPGCPGADAGSAPAAVLPPDAGVGVEVEHEAQRVDAGVGAAAALDVGPTAQHRLQGVLKRSGLRSARWAAPETRSSSCRRRIVLRDNSFWLSS